MPTNENTGYLVQLQSPEGDKVYPIISAEMIKDAEGNTYDLSSLKDAVDSMGITYATKTELEAVSADVEECFQSVSNGKALVASAITDKGVTTAADATFQQMATNIGQIETATSIDLAVRNAATLTFSSFTSNPSMTRVSGPTTMYYTASMGFPPGKAMALELVPSTSYCTVQYRNYSYATVGCRLTPSFTGTQLTGMTCAYNGGSGYASFSVNSIEDVSDGIQVTLRVSTSSSYTSFDQNNKSSSTEYLTIKISGSYRASISASGNITCSL